MCVYIIYIFYIYIYTYIHTYIQTHTHTHARTYTHTHMYMTYAKPNSDLFEMAILPCFQDLFGILRFDLCLKI